MTLTGPGGTGKTRLGLQVAADLLDQFEDGAFFVELAPISDPALVASTIAQALGVARDRSAARCWTPSSSTCGDQQLLLVLDNFEQVLAAATMVDDAAAGLPAPHGAGDQPSGAADRAASTSTRSRRWRCPIPGRPLAVEALSQYGAVALFIERATAIKPDFDVTNANAPAVAEICARLDGLPLAIELAAARIRLLPPEAMLPRLGARPGRCSPAARATSRPGSRRCAAPSPGATTCLPETEQRLFRRLSVFVGRLHARRRRGASATPTADLGVDVLDGIGSLVEQSLVQSDERLDGEPRFRMLETIREYGLEQLRASGEEVERPAAPPGVVRRSGGARQPGVFGPDGAAWLDRFAGGA